MVAEPAPNEDVNKENQRTLRVLDEESRNVASFYDPTLVASVCHRLIYLGNACDGCSIRHELGTDGDPLLRGLHSRDGDRPLMSLAQLHFAKTGSPFARMLLRDHHRKPTGLRRIGNDGAKGHGGSGRLRDATEGDGRNHPGLQQTLVVRYGHFYGENAISLIRIRRNTGHAPLITFGIIL